MTSYRATSVPGILAAILLAAASSDSIVPVSERLAAEGLAGPVAAVVDRIVDGDTIDVRAFIWLGQTLSVRVRIDGVDTPEIVARCDEEKRMALAARDFLERRLMGAEITLTRVVYDKYGGRVRAAVADRHGDIARALLAEGYARPYRGERRQGWCNGES
jgi:micrococcal nuclease